MNRNFRYTALAVALLAAGLLASDARAQSQGNRTRKAPAPGGQAVPTMAPAPAMTGNITATSDKKTAAGEAFFIVASIDQSKAQVLLKRPTEVTLLVRVDSNTKFLDESGQPSKITDFRAGDTVWVTTSGGADQATASRIRKGQMTIADLHRYYLDYPEIK